MAAISGEWIAAGGVVAAVSIGAVKAWLTLGEKFVARPECRLQHEAYDLEFEHRKQRAHETANGLQAVILRLGKLEAAHSADHQHLRWQSMALQSLMKKMGANGVPPPPEE